MKKIIFLLTLMISFHGFSQKYTRITEGGSETGYYSSNIHVDKQGNATFLYNGSGYEKAHIAFAPYENMVYNYSFQEKAVNYALDQIQTGELRGRHIILNEDGRRFRITWKADKRNTNNTKIVMRPLRSKCLVQ